MVQLNQVQDPEAAKKFIDKIKWMYADEDDEGSEVPAESGAINKIGISGRIHSILAVI